jgi:hypothetical protein
MLDFLIVFIALIVALALNTTGRQQFDRWKIKVKADILMYIGLGFLVTANLLFVLGFIMFYLAGLMGLPISGWASTAAIDIVGFGLVFLGAYIFSSVIMKKNPKRGKLAYLLSIAMLTLFFIIFNGSLYLTAGPELEAEKILQIGLPGKATLLDIQSTGVMINEQPRVRLLLEVRPQRGPSYQTEIIMVISPVHLPKFVPGAEFNIKYDPEDKNKIAIESPVGSRP